MIKDKHILPDLKYLRECFRLDETSGILYWKKRPLSHFNYNIKSYNFFNSKFANKVAGSYVDKRVNDYRRVRLDDITYKEHRIIFKMHYGYEPNIIDHINRVENDNRPINLRSTNVKENNENRQFFLNKKSRST